jgi:hypothetical protein
LPIEIFPRRKKSINDGLARGLIERLLPLQERGQLVVEHHGSHDSTPGREDIDSGSCEGDYLGQTRRPAHDCIQPRRPGVERCAHF